MATTFAATESASLADWHDPGRVSGELSHDLSLRHACQVFNLHSTDLRVTRTQGGVDTIRIVQNGAGPPTGTVHLVHRCPPRPSPTRNTGRGFRTRASAHARARTAERPAPQTQKVSAYSTPLATAPVSYHMRDGVARKQVPNAHGRQRAWGSARSLHKHSLAGFSIPAHRTPDRGSVRGVHVGFAVAAHRTRHCFELHRGTA